MTWFKSVVKDEETWLAHAQSTNPFSKWREVHFYVPDNYNTKLATYITKNAIG